MGGFRLKFIKRCGSGNWVIWLGDLYGRAYAHCGCSGSRSFTSSVTSFEFWLRLCSPVLCGVVCLLSFCHLPGRWWDLYRAAAKSQYSKTCTRSFVARNPRCWRLRTGRIFAEKDALTYEFKLMGPHWIRLAYRIRMHISKNSRTHSHKPTTLATVVLVSYT